MSRFKSSQRSNDNSWPNLPSSSRSNPCSTYSTSRWTAPEDVRSDPWRRPEANREHVRRAPGSAAPSRRGRPPRHPRRSRGAVLVAATLARREAHRRDAPAWCAGSDSRRPALPRTCRRSAQRLPPEPGRAPCGPVGVTGSSAPRGRSASTAGPARPDGLPAFGRARPRRQCCRRRHARARRALAVRTSRRVLLGRRTARQPTHVDARSAVRCGRRRRRSAPWPTRVAAASGRSAGRRLRQPGPGGARPRRTDGQVAPRCRPRGHPGARYAGTPPFERTPVDGSVIRGGSPAPGA